MCFRRRRVGALVIIAAVALTLAATPSTGVAGSLDACAQRVIRDWYTGGRVDDVYPLACYRAALRALPDDVLQYSNADQDIRRALAFARRGQNDPGNQATAPAPKASEKANRPTTTPKSSLPATATPHLAPVANEAASPVSKAPIVAETRSSAMSVPYPILALAALAGVLLVAGGVGWLSGRGR